MPNRNQPESGGRVAVLGDRRDLQQPDRTPPAEFLTPILGSGTTVHAVVGRGGNTTSAAAESLRAAVDQTSGNMTVIFAAASFQVALDRLADRLAPELMVEYVVPPGTSSNDDVRLFRRLPAPLVQRIVDVTQRLQVHERPRPCRL